MFYFLFHTRTGLVTCLHRLVHYEPLELISIFIQLKELVASSHKYALLCREFAKERERIEHRHHFLRFVRNEQIMRDVNGYLDWIHTAGMAI